MILDALTREDVQKVREWRNADLTPWRTTYLLTAGMQEDFYRKYVDSRNSPHRYWAIKDEDKFVDGDVGYRFPARKGTLIGMGGLTDISPENRNAEITLTIDPALAGKGYGEKAVGLIYDQAFNYMNLDNVYGEVYWCNEKGVNFWDKIVEKYRGRRVILPNRKYWKGQYYDSDYFNITREGFNGKMQDMRDTEDTPEYDMAGTDVSSVSKLQRTTLY